MNKLAVSLVMFGSLQLATLHAQVKGVAPRPGGQPSGGVAHGKFAAPPMMNGKGMPFAPNGGQGKGMPFGATGGQGKGSPPNGAGQGKGSPPNGAGQGKPTPSGKNGTTGKTGSPQGKPNSNNTPGMKDLRPSDGGIPSPGGNTPPTSFNPGQSSKLPTASSSLANSKARPTYSRGDFSKSIRTGHNVSYHQQVGRGFRHGTFYFGRTHAHWSFCYFDMRYGSLVYWDPCVRGYYYWCEPDFCFYPVTYCPYRTYAWCDRCMTPVDGTTPVVPIGSVADAAQPATPENGEPELGTPADPSSPGLAPVPNAEEAQPERSEPAPNTEPGIPNLPPVVPPQQGPSDGALAPPPIVNRPQSMEPDR